MAQLNGTKWCGRCERTRPLSAFSKNRRRADGLQSYCKPCKSRVDREWYERRGGTQRKRNRGYVARNARYVWDYLLRHPCVDCGEGNPVVLEFDHVRGDKVNAVSNMVQRQFSIAALDEEIAKCEVRCANCHKIKTAREHGWHVHIPGQGRLDGGRPDRDPGDGVGGP